MTRAAVPDDQIIRLMQVPEQDRREEWIERSLQSAIALELSTIPPYLCAMWSIKDPTHPVATMIKNIVLDEMFHMALVCNIMNAIGGTPTIKDAALTYPSHLPGGVHHDLCVTLAGLTKEQVRTVFMEIEMPEQPLALALIEGPPTIGAFYDGLMNAFQTVKPPISTNKQLTPSYDIGENKLELIEDLAGVLNAIELIKEQGEGTSTSPEAPHVDAAGELAHYYKFGEIYKGHKFRQVNGKWDWTGDVFPFPEVYPMGTVPHGGWPNPPDTVRVLLEKFNAAYTDILQDLQRAWEDGDIAVLNNAVGKMENLKDAGVTDLLKIPLPGGDGNYGPEFLVVPT
ncbi:MAG: ferritin-like protein [Pseudonocardia sp.]|nr:ferritin-like protein [Pseudonocardia sp.]